MLRSSPVAFPASLRGDCKELRRNSTRLAPSGLRAGKPSLCFVSDFTAFSGWESASLAQSTYQGFRGGGCAEISSVLIDPRVKLTPSGNQPGRVGHSPLGEDGRLAVAARDESARRRSEAGRAHGTLVVVHVCSSASSTHAQTSAKATVTSPPAPPRPPVLHSNPAKATFTTTIPPLSLTTTAEATSPPPTKPPIKEHLGYNFIGLIFGLVSDTHKRLEKVKGFSYSFLEEL
nr:splicing factor 1 isoform X1 [Ipomoea batatas]